MSFDKLNLIKTIHTAVTAEGYSKPTPIQAQAIPVILERKDLLGCAQTGTGKTAAFAIPILQILSESREIKKDKKSIRALILTPTRELAVQIGDSFNTYGKHTGLRNTVVYGGVSQQKQTDKLRKGVDILVATPGRLLDLMNQGYINLQKVEMFVLDEADRMLDMGFIVDIKTHAGRIDREPWLQGQSGRAFQILPASRRTRLPQVPCSGLRCWRAV
ncbi:MAG: DEAD/DEAH box helicase, partial [Ignavibacteriaceae bacterium]